MRRTQLLAGFVVLAVSTATLFAGDHFLTIGGGYSAAGNQASLEKNVLYFQRVLAGLHLNQAPHAIFFADGTDPARDLQYDNSRDPGGELNRMLAHIIGPSRGVEHAYRTSQIPGVSGGANVASIDRYFNNDAWRLHTGDRLMLYFTGHGGKGRKAEPQNTVMYLWNNGQLSVREITQRLDKVPVDVPVVLVMVQCYSGGFANVIFEGGDAGADVDAHDRCGFFATVHDRMAAGCTAGVDEEEYREYSSYFWAALWGVDRLGKPISGTADYNGDGVVSFNEAHAYAMIHEHSVDIPVKTSDAFLRRFSSLKPVNERGGGHVFLLPSSSYAELRSHASAADRAVLEELSHELGLVGDDRAKAARTKAEACNTQKAKLEGDQKRVQRDLTAVKRGIAEELKLRWPELESPWNPALPKLLATDGPAIKRFIERHRDYQRYLKLVQQVQQLEDQQEEQEQQWAKCQRLLRVLENVALEVNLPAVAEEGILERYHRLLKSEAGTLK